MSAMEATWAVDLPAGSAPEPRHLGQTRHASQPSRVSQPRHADEPRQLGRSRQWGQARPCDGAQRPVISIVTPSTGRSVRMTPAVGMTPAVETAAERRRLHARQTARWRALAQAKVWLGRGAVTVVFSAAVSTMVWAFLSVPNIPLP